MNDVSRLIDALRSSREVMSLIVEHHSALFKKDIGAYVSKAWPEVKGHFDIVEKELLKPDPHISKRLSFAGLDGVQLDLKLKGFNASYENLKLFKLLGFFDSTKKKALRKLLLKILKWINILLGSISSLIPAGEAIKEYKEAIEAGLEEGDDEDDN